MRAHVRVPHRLAQGGACKLQVGSQVDITTPAHPHGAADSLRGGNWKVIKAGCGGRAACCCAGWCGCWWPAGALAPQRRSAHPTRKPEMCGCAAFAATYSNANNSESISNPVDLHKAATSSAGMRKRPATTVASWSPSAALAALAKYIAAVFKDARNRHKSRHREFHAFIAELLRCAARL